jgi:hypothetical protein
VLLLVAELEPADCVYCMIQGCLGTSASFMRLACSFTSSLQQRKGREQTQSSVKVG